LGYFTTLKIEVISSSERSGCFRSTRCLTQKRTLFNKKEDGGMKSKEEGEGRRRG
jgi:hypothetical protein